MIMEPIIHLVTDSPNAPLPRMKLSELIQLIETTLDDRKAEQLVTVDLKGKSDFADAMVIATGTSQRHVAGMADYVVKALKDAGYPRVPVEGLETAEWVLVDAGDVIVHLFRPEARERYNLEKMWSVVVPPQE